MIGCESGSCEQSFLLIPESVSEQRRGTGCGRDAHQILLFVLVSLTGTFTEEIEEQKILYGAQEWIYNPFLELSQKYIK